MKKNKISEATSAGSSGKFKTPIVLAPQIWGQDQLEPFVQPVYTYTNAELAYEEADGDFKQSKEKRTEIEKKTKKMSKASMYLKKSYMGQNDEEGGVINPTASGQPQKEINFLKEDLAVWFGTKKKKKGSNQPQGPWVNICRKKEGGGHPPCGRSEAESKGYPKCRARSVAAKMSDSQKKSACAQKRKAEKTNPKSGTGNKPKMVSYKPKKKNESTRDIIKKILQETLVKRNLV